VPRRGSILVRPSLGFLDLDHEQSASPRSPASERNVVRFFFFFSFFFVFFSCVFFFFRLFFSFFPSFWAVLLSPPTWITRGDSVPSSSCRKRGDYAIKKTASARKDAEIFSRICGFPFFLCTEGSARCPGRPPCTRTTNLSAFFVETLRWRTTDRFDVGRTTPRRKYGAVVGGLPCQSPINR